MPEPRIISLPDACSRIALCGGPYSNFAAVETFLAETAEISHRFCLGDLGGFGPYPDRTIELLRHGKVACIQGNYDEAVGHGMVDCGCGYLDPLDRKFAQLSYDYTYSHTSEMNKSWLRELPQQMILKWRQHSILLCHGSPEQINEFVWESETGDAKIREWLEAYKVTGICATHSGIPWIRSLDDGFWLNVGVLGRPAHEGMPRVYYATLEFSPSDSMPRPQLVPMDYDPTEVIAAMRGEKLPEEFCRSLQEGIWTTCSGILPDTERVVKIRQAAPAEPQTSSSGRLSGSR
ncbi:metallophosphoesterase family protein [Oligoflexus tunisiensis]|uniref:metallophosphoesterase family protein n=1 Tax=Oligoflexus tunisiensis TaxID=708132 RepID=UPI000A8CAABC|nr:metallophosphoesterase [Oligoflexus tunisiensis]